MTVCVGDMVYKICLEWFCPQSSECGVEVLIALCTLACIIYIILCASALPERLLEKDLLVHFSNFLLEVMPKLCVPVP